MLDMATHIAGPVVRIGNRLIQRCALCGDKLLDCNMVGRQLNVWGEGAFVQAGRGELNYAGDFLNASELPDDFCLELVE